MIEHIALKQIEAFIDKYPDEEWGCGHIVFSDYNLLDSDIHSSIVRGYKSLLGELPEMDYDIENTKHSIKFLEHLLTIPEDDRIYWTDDDD